ncbi:Bacteroidetes-specific putative membrane protein [Psychroflexus torquis ATCC 700755]|uniref:Bacteroidetes-specific putative membrane protein n=1 Tax=Psychroflexus torquis (strain ATCC 700755 / CIP 106069 / ACAM 623) TaxID=313595 RepID=K4ICS8_PSYTT|nr:type IX secretion system membrane protein PorP/SprF [Psychroflexus torquis]AFU67678.1 Bacteroidetes-specific putative membrane protein [Psychroflexus torquis ATCC 700755]
MAKRRILNITLVCSLLVLATQTVSAQQDPNFTQYMYNTLSINPAYAGSRDVLSAVALHRSQWLGFNGAPTSQTFSAHTPISEGKMGLGFNIVNDQIGITQETDINAVYSYALDMSRYTKLSFGINAGVNLMNIDYRDLNIFDPTDPEFNNNIENKISPQVGLGALLYNDKYFVGLSVPSLLRNDRFSDNSIPDATVRDRLHYFLTAGVVFDLTPTLKFKPSVLFRHVSGSPLLAELSSNFLINDRFTLGAAYRLNSAFSGIVGFQASDSILLGIAYDRDISTFSSYNDGSLEFFVRFELFKKYKRMYTPRFF